jgi:hypothetical protein
VVAEVVSSHDISLCTDIWFELRRGRRGEDDIVILSGSCLQSVDTFVAFCLLRSVLDWDLRCDALEVATSSVLHQATSRSEKVWGTDIYGCTS